MFADFATSPEVTIAVSVKGPGPMSIAASAKGPGPGTLSVVACQSNMTA
jgi:hypothetical protein